MIDIPGFDFDPTPTEVTGDFKINPALDHILQLLDVGEIRICRHDVQRGGPAGIKNPQLLTIEVTRKTDGENFSAGVLMSRDKSPGDFRIVLAHLLEQGVDRVKRG